MSIPLEIRNTVRAAPVGICIYCHDAHRRPGEKLSEEHVIPFGLGGRFIIPEASCSRCAGITGAFEERVLRGFMRDARVVAGLPTRRPKERPQTIPLQAKQGEGFQLFELPLSEALGFLHLPTLSPSSFLTGQPPVTGVNLVGIETIHFGKPLEDVAAALNTRTIQTTVNFDITAFARLLAKIGYGFAVAQLGPYSLSEVPVLPMILGTVDDGSTWVGSADYELPVEEKKPTHAVGFVELNRRIGNETEAVLISRVKLFANTGATGYDVVVRRRRA